MANPYHDENGKFCSRNEMQHALERVQLSGDFGSYVRLRGELEAADNSTFKEVQPEKLDGWGNLFDKPYTPKTEEESAIAIASLAERTTSSGLFLQEKQNPTESYRLAYTYAQGLPESVQNALYTHTVQWFDESSREQEYKKIADAVIENIKPF